MRGFLLPLFLCTIDIISAIFAGIVSVYLRFDGMPAQYISMLIAQLPAFVVVMIGSLYLYRLYSRIWRYAGSRELLSIVCAVFSGTVAWVLYSMAIGVLLPRSLYIITAFLLIVLVGGSRLFLKIYSDITAGPGKTKEMQRVLIVGAGDAGAMLAREIQQYHTGSRRVIGFVDDDPNKRNKMMFGSKVLGDRFAIKEMVCSFDVSEIIIAMPSIKGREIREIVNICKETECTLKILPGIYEIIEGTATVGQLRPVEVEDLLGRDPVELDVSAVKTYINNKIVLVTGAGGSIGSEICRQVAKMGPRKLLLLGKGENSIYEINGELTTEYPLLKKVPIIADVRDQERIKEIMDYFQPQVVFHAAAHKHVPLMEEQPVEAVRNNVWGTKVLAEAAAAHKVETFVMISTDKAVNPTSVMGCTKRVAEMFVQSMNGSGTTRFVAVRFGNVLGSRGSVIPLFKKQIARGGPVTVTDKEMKRYFMTIPEASSLVLQAGAMAAGGEVFVLDMGEPVKIYDLAKDLITLSGYTPNVDMEIRITGLRPGEKLFEELLSAEDGTETTKHKKIFTARLKKLSKLEVDESIDILLNQKNGEDVVTALAKIVPTYMPNRIKK